VLGLTYRSALRNFHCITDFHLDAVWFVNVDLGLSLLVSFIFSYVLVEASLYSDAFFCLVTGNQSFQYLAPYLKVTMEGAVGSSHFSFGSVTSMPTINITHAF